MRDRSIHADRTDEKDRDDYPEGKRTQALLPGLAGNCNGSSFVPHRTTLDDVAPTKRQAEQQGKTAERKVGGPPARAADDCLRKDWQDHGAQAGSHHYESQSQAQPLMAWDKNNTYRLAEELDIPVPGTWNLESADDLPRLYYRLPLAVEPAVKENFFYVTGDKAWRAESPEQLHALYQRAAKQINTKEILIQEIIPGDGLRQFSYCAFFRDGHAHSTLLARRMRQHPREFGRAATYVETIDLPEIEALSERFLRAINFRGIVEMEYKQDPRNGKYKLLDVNARGWGFHGLGQAAGVDFPYLSFADQLGWRIVPARAPAGIGWLRLLPDLSIVPRDLFDGYLKPGDYWKSLKNTRMESVFDWKDPLPSLAEFALLPYIIKKKFGKHLTRNTPHLNSRSPMMGARPAR
jgi:D-aspartate ligase